MQSKKNQLNWATMENDMHQTSNKGQGCQHLLLH